ncbi:hypothetical protein AGOR_G00120650 [Albula goreensis]|uniref:Fucolectin tachylectin-4 pentraxin-1 domain-containing protein n=1 Tax=Albula goreensis TaxID=1534307 RepID=A0A8T3DF33_9TELE|nr:hypothetical protein AGOR_G00120650 [Albula goreensis]
MHFELTCHLTDRMKVKTVILLLQILAISSVRPDPPPQSLGAANLVNVALRGKATQSAIYTSNEGRCQADAGIDGNRDSNWNHGSCFVTTNAPNPWWKVDLLQSYIIASVTITNRGDCCAERINGAQIHVGNSLENNGIDNPLCSVVDTMSAGETKTFQCEQPMLGRYVTVYIPRHEYLHLCEVEVNALVQDDA